MVVKILFVCLGNICRSPTAEGVFRGIARQSGVDVQVDSAGTSGWHDGDPPDRRSMAEAKKRGYDLSAQRSRKLVAADFDLFDLIIGMDAGNLDDIQRMAQRGCRAELKLLLEYAPEQPVRDVPDPYYEDNFAGVFELIELACHGLLRDLKQGSALHQEP